MPSTNPILQIPFISSELPTCNPHLMPFHIDYSGPAAVSAYMRVEKVIPESSTLKNVEASISKDIDAKSDLAEASAVEAAANAEMREDTTISTITERPILPNVVPGQDMRIPLPSTSSLESVGSESQTLSVTTESTSTLVNDSQASLASEPTPVSPPPPVLEDADRRFVSTFRGRTIHGLTIDLPAGYSGLVLQSEAENIEPSSTKDDTQKSSRTRSKGKAAADVPARPRGRLTRSAVSKRPEVITVEDDDIEMAGSDLKETNTDDPDLLAATVDGRRIRNLVPISQFSSFTLWHADRPVDRGNDEYSRTLTEWISLAHEIHRTDI